MLAQFNWIKNCDLFEVSIELSMSIRYSSSREMTQLNNFLMKRFTGSILNKMLIRYRNLKISFNWDFI